LRLKTACVGELAEEHFPYIRGATTLTAPIHAKQQPPGRLSLFVQSGSPGRYDSQTVGPEITALQTYEGPEESESRSGLQLLRAYDGGMTRA
jgi:hypothetical protein